MRLPRPGTREAHDLGCECMRLIGGDLIVPSCNMHNVWIAVGAQEKSVKTHREQGPSAGYVENLTMTDVQCISRFRWYAPWGQHDV